ncbi:major facilitator superfamily domain-containing protein [Cadophora sp. MPI-SDFR-AT-0126]|nr:major facilitator superfamily domain-containing protein [Leotiomycetes sp. MPI-SDFR-AT-0126]
MIKYVYQTVTNYTRTSHQSDPQRLNTSSTFEGSDGRILASSSPGECTECAAERRVTYLKSWGFILGLLPAYFVASLELTIVATALPEIASHFNKFDQLNWPVTAFTLTSTAFIPVFGQFADTFGRHASLQSAAVLSLIGSIMCAAAPSWPVLLLGRALQGVGAAGIDNVTMIILADQASMKEQAVNMSIFQLLNGIGYSVGPVIGGHLTKLDWRYCFALCAAIVFLSHFTIFALRGQLKPGNISVLRPSDIQSRTQALVHGFSTVDYIGMFIFIAGVCFLIMGTTWGGSTFPWDSAAVVSCLVIGGVSVTIFALIEHMFEPGRVLSRLFPQTIPMIPASLLRKKDVGIICFISVGAGAAFYSIFYFVGIFFTVSEARTASEAGTKLLYYIPGLGIGVYAAIRCCNYWPRQTFWALFIGNIFQTAGIAGLAAAVNLRNEKLVAITMAITGAGTGAIFMPSNLHLARMLREHLAPAYSLMRFSLPFGGTIALAIMNSVFQNRLGDISSTTPDADNAGAAKSQWRESLESLSSLPEALSNAIRSQAVTGVMWAFISIAPIVAVATIMAAFLGNVWIPAEATQSDATVDHTGRIDENGHCAKHAAGNIGSGGGMPAATEMVQLNGTKTQGTYTEAGACISSIYLLELVRDRVEYLKSASIRGVTTAPGEPTFTA